MQAVIFFNNKKWLSNEPRCFGVRFEGQALPVGSAVVGFVTDDGETLAPPAMTPGQEESYNDALSYASAVLDGTWESDEIFPQIL